MAARIVAFLAALAVLAAVVAGDAPRLPLLEQQYLPGSAPSDAGWQPSLAPPAARLAYAAGDGMYIMPFGGRSVRVAGFVELTATRPQQDFATEIEWSADGRYLAWSQQLMDDPGYEDQMRADRLVTWTLLDTATGRRRVWSDPASFVFPLYGDEMAFVGDRLLIWSDGHLVVAGMTEDPGDAVSFPALSESRVVGATGAALIVRQDEQFVRILPAGTAEPVGRVAGEIVAARYDPRADRFALVLRERHSDCDWSDTVAVATGDLSDAAPLRMPPLPDGQRWHAGSRSLRFAADGSVDALLTRDVQVCGDVRSDQVHLHQRGDDLVPDPAFTGADATAGIAVVAGGYRVVQPAFGPSDEAVYVPARSLTVYGPDGQASTVTLGIVGQVWDVSAAGSSGGSPRPSVAPPAVDARNLTYRTTCGGLTRTAFDVTVRTGHGEAVGPDGRPYRFTVGATAAGDLTGDGRPETVVVLVCAPADANFGGWDLQVVGGDGAALAGIVVDPLPEALYPAVDWAHGELAIRDRRLSLGVLYYGPDDCHACGPSIHRVLEWRWDGSRLVAV
ncbi:hypothetical protein ABZS66_32010 [Dactylosporangium sp. NPDC005572]|uniref:hypothetical protein n=1 Tax=Dactylosporangium sp. NPDC005572 TaxID=3156889 RepID=UPI0033A0FF3E